MSFLIYIGRSPCIPIHEVNWDRAWLIISISFREARASRFAQQTGIAHGSLPKGHLKVVLFSYLYTINSVSNFFQGTFTVLP